MPFAAIHRLADLVEIHPRLEGHELQQVAGVILARERKARIIPPLVRIADLGREAGPLLQRLGAGFRPHPRKPLDAPLQHVGKVPHQRLHLGLGFGREHRLHVELAQRFAERAGEFVHHPLPARRKFRLAAQRLVVEVEAFLGEGAGKIRRYAVDLVIAQVRLPRGDRRIGQHRIGFPEEIARGQRELRRPGHAHGIEERAPGEVRRQRIGLIQRRRLILLGRIAQFHARRTGTGQPRLERHHGLRQCPRRFRRFAGQYEHCRNVIGQRLPRLLVIRAVFQVVGTFGQRKPALAGIGDRLRGIAEILGTAEAEQRAAALRRGFAQIRRHLRRRGQRRHAIQDRLDRRDAGLLDRRLVHAGGIEIPYQLLHAGGLRIGRSGLRQRVLDRQRTLAQHLETAPGGAIPRHRVGGEPLAVDVGVEVAASRDRAIQVAGLELDLLGRDAGQVYRRGNGSLRSGRGRGSGTGFGRRRLAPGQKNGPEGQRQRGTNEETKHGNTAVAGKPSR